MSIGLDRIGKPKQERMSGFVCISQTYIVIAHIRNASFMKFTNQIYTWIGQL
jgi:hypothetical protein